MKNISGPSRHNQFPALILALIPALIPAFIIAAALLAAAALIAMSAWSGHGFKQACESVRSGASWQEASQDLVKNGAVVTGWGGPTGGPILKRDWGREAFPFRRQRCDLTLDENGMVTKAAYEWWFKYGPSQYHMARLKQVLGLQNR
jgi:hypothetical protein